MRSQFRAVVFAVLGCISALSTVAQTAQENAWTVLNKGLAEGHSEKRLRAVGELGLLLGDTKAENAALALLDDDKPEVRAAAAQALAEIGAKSARPQLMRLRNDPDPSVIIAGAHALIVLGDNRGYGVYYAILTGEQKTGTSLTDQQKKMLHDRRKLAAMGFQAGLGFVPFGGMGLTAFKTLTKDDTSPVLAAAAIMLAKDPDPKSGKALANAAEKQEKWLVRAAAFEAIAERGDPALKPVAMNGLQDEKEEVQYSAAAAVIRLADIEEHPKKAPKPAKKLSLRSSTVAANQCGLERTETSAT